MRLESVRPMPRAITDVIEGDVEAGIALHPEFSRHYSGWRRRPDAFLLDDADLAAATLAALAPF